MITRKVSCVRLTGLQTAIKKGSLRHVRDKILFVEFDLS